MAYILGIETSCDETSAAIVADGTRVLADVVASQIELHQRYGGVVPELASRQHLENLPVVVEAALQESGIRLGDVGAVAVTYGPGLIGALLVGVSFAKAVALARQVPLVAVHHTVAHAYGCWLEYGGLPLPAVCLIVSGGHTSLLYWQSHEHLRILGTTRDDAAGEAFDKVARLLGLPYPGGAALERLARQGDPAAIRFPRAWLEPASLDFSFSGIKTSVSNYLKAHPDASRADVAASFQAAVVDVLVGKTIMAARQEQVRSIVLAGGVAANSHLRQRLAAAAGESAFAFFAPRPEFCTDNAAMVASAGFYRLQRGQVAGLNLEASSCPVLEI
ncbi:MAG: tRNA (adenosine(37)-N6)-threonylcarbamoyltransferase complex transferase subunit TsaD [Clostridia bacterium]|nr:MAG: tRNA (adenosine(37)-N6)-threonylcarbamoyltransferase complex transferase subunit TsaD [Clostridia bacterium]